MPCILLRKIKNNETRLMHGSSSSLGMVAWGNLSAGCAGQCMVSRISALLPDLPSLVLRLLHHLIIHDELQDRLRFKLT